jgi:hypothetical protein
MVVRIPRACASKWMRRGAWIPLFFSSLAALVTSFVSTTVHGQATTPPRAAGQPSRDELVPSEKRADDGLTLNQAVERFLKENLERKAMRLELPMAQAGLSHQPARVHRKDIPVSRGWSPHAQECADPDYGRGRTRHALKWARERLIT